MKKLYLAMSVLLGVILMTSCGSDSTAKLLKAIPAETDMVVVGNVKTIIESAGGSISDSKLQLPKLIADNLSESDSDQLDEINEMLKNSGVEVDQAAVTLDYKSGNPIFLFMLADRSKFIGYIEDNGFELQDEEDGAQYYSKKTYESEYDSDYDDYSYIAVKDSYVYFSPEVWVQSSFKPMKAIKRMIEDAADDPMVSTEMADYLISGNAGGIAVRIPEELKKEMRRNGVPSQFVDMYKGYVCMTGSLNGDKATATLRWFDENGKPRKFDELTDFFNTGARIDSDALDYINTNEQLVCAVAMKDVKWDKYFEALQGMPGIPAEAAVAFSVASAYLEKLDGTIAFGIGINEGLQSIADIYQGRNVLAQLPATIVIQTRDGKAKGMMNDVTSLIESINMPNYQKTADGWTLEVPELGGAVYGAATDDMLIFSTTPISKKNSNPTVKELDFTKNLAYFGVVLNRDNKLMRDLGIDYDIIAYSTSNVDTMEGVMGVQIKGGENEGFLAKAIRIGFDIAERESEIGRQWESYTGRSNSFEHPMFDYDDYDTEEVVVGKAT